MTWLQIHLTVDKERAPLVELLFENLNALSVSMDDAEDDPQLEPKPGESPLWQQTRVTGLFDADTDPRQLHKAIEEALSTDVSRNLQIETLQDQAWERAWMDAFQPMQFGKRLWVCPSGQKVSSEDAVVIELDPGLAFGTGTHPTTALCLSWLDSQSLAGKQVIDFGCGSGILAVGALLLGANSVIAIDHDPQALEATQANAEKNGVADRLIVKDSQQPPPDACDILLANILAGTLIELYPLLSSLTLPKGDIVLSGVLQEQTDQVLERYRSGFDMHQPKQLDEWMLLTGKAH